MYQETTHSIAVTVTPIYLEEQSEPDENQYIWAYHVQIENQSARRCSHRWAGTLRDGGACG